MADEKREPTLNEILRDALRPGQERRAQLAERIFAKPSESKNDEEGESQ